jgi:hypothetical protein
MSSRPWLKALPPVLVIQLKRFEYSASGESTKLADAIPFPLRDLDMSSYVLPRGTDAGASSPSSKFAASLASLVSPLASAAAAKGAGAGVGAGASASAGVNAGPGPGSGPGSGAGTGAGASANASALQQDGGSLYDLFGIVCHVGNAERGHYTAFSRSLASGSDWHYYDDAVVSPVREDEVSSERVASLAYVLFYARRRAGAKAPQQSAAALAREQAWRLAHPPAPPGSSGPSSSSSAASSASGGGGGGGAAGLASREAERERSAASDHAIALALASGQMLV